MSLRMIEVNPEFWADQPAVAGKQIASLMADAPADLWLVLVGQREVRSDFLEQLLHYAKPEFTLGIPSTEDPKAGS